MEKGQDVDELALPIDITSDYICGCSKQERMNNFATIIKDLSSRKNEAQAKLDKSLQTFQAGNKREIEKNVKLNFKL